MLISDLEHLEPIDAKTTALRGSSGILFLDLASKTLSLKLGDTELFKTELPSFISQIALSLTGNQAVSISSTTTSANGANPQSLVSIVLSQLQA